MLQVGRRAGTAIVPLSAVTAKTKVVDQSVFVITGLGDTTTPGDGVLYAGVWCERDSNNVYKLFGVFEGEWDTAVTASSVTLTTNITFINQGSAGQTCSCSLRDAGGNGISDEIEVIRCLKNSSGIFIDMTSVSDPKSIQINFGGVILESKPSWFDANAEASTDASIYIEPASATQAGLINTSAQSFAGLKDFTQGVDVTAVAGSFYEENLSWTPTFTAVVNITNAFGDIAALVSGARYVKVGKMVSGVIIIDGMTQTSTGLTSITFNLPFNFVSSVAAAVGQITGTSGVTLGSGCVVDATSSSGASASAVWTSSSGGLVARHYIAFNYIAQ